MPLSLYNLVFIKADIELGASEASYLKNNALFTMRMPVCFKRGIEFLNAISLNLMSQVIQTAILNNVKMHGVSHGAQDIVLKGKGKAIPLQAWSGPEGSRKLRFPDFVTTAQDGGKVVSLTHRPPLPPGNAPGTHFC